MLKPKRRISKKELKQDEFLEFIYNAERFIRRNAKMITYATIGVAAVVVVAFFMYNSRQQANMNAASAIGAAQALYDQGNYQQSIERLQPVIEDYRGTKSAGVGVFYLASAHSRLGNDDQAAEYFRMYLDKYDNDSLLGAAALAGLGAIEAAQESYSAAARYYERAARRVTLNFLAQRYRLEQIRYTFEAGDKQQARKMLTSLLENDELDTSIESDAEELYAHIEVQTAE